MSGGRHLKKGSEIPVIPNDSKLRLYTMRFCPYAHRIHLVLDAKGIPYHSIFINLKEKPEWYKDKNPLSKVPAIELVNEPGNPTIFESLIVAEYLDEKYPQRPLFPKDPLQKALDKILIERFSEITSLMLKVFFHATKEEPGPITEILQGLDLYEKELIHRKMKFFGGSKPGMLDYMIWPWFERISTFQYLVGDNFKMEEGRFPRLIQWQSLLKDDSAVKVMYLSGETHLKFIQDMRNGCANPDMLCS